MQEYFFDEEPASLDIRHFIDEQLLLTRYHIQKAHGVTHRQKLAQGLFKTRLRVVQFWYI